MKLTLLYLELHESFRRAQGPLQKYMSARLAANKSCPCCFVWLVGWAQWGHLNAWTGCTCIDQGQAKSQDKTHRIAWQHHIIYTYESQKVPNPCNAQHASVRQDRKKGVVADLVLRSSSSGRQRHPLELGCEVQDGVWEREQGAGQLANLNLGPGLNLQHRLHCRHHPLEHHWQVHQVQLMQPCWVMLQVHTLFL